jgi:hypothetical protein
MNKTKTVVIALAALLGTAISLPAGAQMCAPAQPCGDVNSSQDVTIADALSVLRHSIELPTSLICSCGGDGVTVAGLLETGQTNCWPRNDASNPVPLAPCAGTGEDGEYLRGAALQYVDNGDGTITDLKTSLMWEKLYNDNSVLHDYDNFSYLWEGAFKKVDDLNADNFAGHSDWRLPNIRELDSLVVFDQPSYSVNVVSIDPVFATLCSDSQVSCTEGQVEACSCTKNLPYWSSTTSEQTAASTASAWVVDFSTGTRSTQPKNTYKYVRAVRGGTEE